MKTRRQTDEDRDRGLCSTCSRRDTCSLQDVEGGVWHCAEYREDNEHRRREPESAADINGYESGSNTGKKGAR
jgi:hypothetical protein